MNKNINAISEPLFAMLRENTQQNRELHSQFLTVRQEGLGQLTHLIARQMQEMASNGAAALFTAEQLAAFGVGRVSDCLGPDFARYDALRIPRIPNGDLRMMDRIVAIEGVRRNFSAPASVVVEYDVPADAWYLQDAPFPDLPYALWMETALQPCGFLSAYLDTYSLIAEPLFYFRNLDGSAQRGPWVDVRGQTITTRARMISHVNIRGTVIQKFSFELSCAGQKVYWGESTFGYFTAQTMKNQVGLDGGQSALMAYQRDERLNQSLLDLDAQAFQVSPAGRPADRLASGRMHFLDHVRLAAHGGQYGRGYVAASRAVDAGDWFYPFHFYQDPVMPGSLGVEAVIEAMQLFALATGAAKDFSAPRLRAAGALTWRYRGQITSQNQQMRWEVHIRSVEKQAGSVWVVGDASVWADGLRIYELTNAAIEIMEA